jgi:hypothetical protein
VNGPPAGGRRPGGRSSATPLIQAASQWLLGVALAATLTAFFLAVNAVQLSSQSAGQRLLRREVAVSTNIDAILPDLQESLREAAREGDDDPVRLPDFPLAVDIPRDEALTLEGEALRERILDEAGQRLYDDGMSAWASADGDGDREIETVSAAGAVDLGLGLVTERNHDIVLVVATVLGFFSLMLAVLLVATARSWTRLIALSAAATAAALPSLAAAVGLRFAFRTGQEEADPFVYGLLDLGVEAMWVPILNYLALTVLGLSVMMITLVFMWVASRYAAGHPGGSAA